MAAAEATDSAELFLILCFQSPLDEEKKTHMDGMGRIESGKIS